MGLRFRLVLSLIGMVLGLLIGGGGFNLLSTGKLLIASLALIGGFSLFLLSLWDCLKIRDELGW